MKTTLILLVVSLLLYSCTQSDKSVATKRTVITGQVSNFSEVSNHDFIEFIYQDILANQEKLAENIDSSGQFKFVVDLDYPTEFFLKYSSLLAFFVSPGDSIHFDIDSECWKVTTETYADEYAFYKVSGTAEKMNDDVAKYKALFLDSLINWEYQDSMIKSKSPEEYKAFMRDVINERVEITEQFNKDNKTCKQFQDWIQLELKFQEWDDLMRYRWLKPMYSQANVNEFMDSIPDSYYSFLDDWDRENQEYLESKSYLGFLHEYAMYLDQSIPADTQKVYRALYETDFEKSMSFFPRYYQEVESGFIKDVLIAKFYYRMFDAKYYDRMKNIYDPELIGDALLREKVQDKVDEEKELFENPEFAEGSNFNELTEENEFVKALISKYPDKVIYIDFWAPWCAPCMGEMPYSGKLKAAFQGKDVVFVYLANRCEETAWKSTIAEKKIEGEHFLLTEKQYANLVQLFGITGIPHYVLIDKKGDVVDKAAKRPSSGDVLINEIEDLLN